MASRPENEAALDALLRVTEGEERMRTSILALDTILLQTDSARVGLQTIWAKTRPDPSHTAVQRMACEILFHGSIPSIADFLKEQERLWQAHLKVLTETYRFNDFEREVSVYSALEDSGGRVAVKGIVNDKSEQKRCH